LFATLAVVAIAGTSASPAERKAEQAERVDIPADPSALILTVQLPDPEQQVAPFPLWVSPETGLMIEFPVPVVAIQGRKARIV